MIVTMYFLFAGDACYPSGCALDFRGVFTSIEEAKESVNLNKEDWAHIALFDKGKLIVVAHNNGGETCVGKNYWIDGDTSVRSN